MKTTTIIELTFLLAGGLTAPWAQAQGLTNRATCFGTAGGRTGTARFAQVSAAGQPGGVSVSASASGNVVNYAGFLGPVTFFPNRDTDKDGLADEADPDNDNDGLDDWTEVTGLAFSPQTTTNPNEVDTDGDGVDDNCEAFAGTDPTDPHAFLRFLSIREVHGGVELLWLSRGGHQYRIKGTSDLCPYPFPELLTLHYEPPTGLGPWMVTTSAWVDVTAPRDSIRRFYSLEAMPPLIP